MAALLGRMSMILSMQAGPPPPLTPPEPPGPSRPGMRSDSLIRPQIILRNSGGGRRPGPPPPTPPSSLASAARFALFASSPIAYRYRSSSLDRFPCSPTLGWADLQTLPPCSRLPHVRVAKRFSDRNAATRRRNGASSSPPAPSPAPLFLRTAERGPTRTDGYVEHSPYEALAWTTAAHGLGYDAVAPPPPSTGVPPRGSRTPCLPYSSRGTKRRRVGLTSGWAAPSVLS
mmetsp:Transcript_17478/g.40770  ORF Transcript_17478/g.40770 Transcript_17478/m.40770 type:complete len:230 (-) Transcript_17478:1250-1939(-)